MLRALAKIVENGHLRAASSRCTGASTAARRWPRRRSNTQTRSRRRSTSPTTRSIRRRWPRSSASTPATPIVAVPIWTTTPWTLPAILAVTLGPELDYVLVEGPARDGRRVLLVLAEALRRSGAARATASTTPRVLGRAQGAALEGTAAAASVLRARDPGDPRRPRHRRRRHRRRAHRARPRPGRLRGRPEVRPARVRAINPVGGNGVYLPSTPNSFAGQYIWKANDAIVELLRERGVLLAIEKLTHSYPHCWRHKTPVVFRATPQWFISHGAGQPARATRSPRSRTCSWIPDWGEARIAGMVDGRPDWCISRQRTWGVPIALFVDKRDRRAASAQRRADARGRRPRASSDGVDAWFALDAGELLGDEARRLRQGHRHPRRLVRFRRHPRRRARRAAAGRPAQAGATCTSKAPTSIAAGSRPRC